MGLVQSIDSRFYPQFERNWDDLLFREKLLAFIHPQAMVLDLGAGAGIVGAMNFRGLAARVCGVDLDPRVIENPYLDEGVVADAEKIPYPDGTFDLVFADNVMEHIDEPPQVFTEIARVLRPGGKLMFKTPNKTHYMPLIARLTPHQFHKWINSKRGRHEIDTFPTRYRCNAPTDVRDIAGRTGLAIDRIDLIEGRPEYLRVSVPTYLVGLAYERLVNTTDLFARLRILMIATLSKRDCF